MPPTPGNQNNLTNLQQTAQDIAVDISNIQNDLFTATDRARDMAKQLSDSSLATKSLFEDSTRIKNELKDSLNLAKKLGNEYLTQKEVQERILNNQAELSIVNHEINKVADKYMKANSNIVDLAQAEAELVKEIQDLRSKGQPLTEEHNRFELMLSQRGVIKDIDRILVNIGNNIEAGNDAFDRTKIKASAIQKIFTSIANIPVLNAFMDFRRLADKFTVSNKEGFKELGKQLLNIFKSPLVWILAAVVAIKALIKLAFDYDKIVTNMSNNMAISRESSVGILDSYRRLSAEGINFTNSLENVFLTTKNIANAQLELQDAFEANTMFSVEMLENQILLTKQMGMSKEEALGIQKFSLLTGKSAESILNIAMKQNTTAISYRKIFSEISKVNAEISSMYKNNPELIAKAVVEANKLGVSLEQTQKISKSLLDFESSISGELEAELLLGKRFNFEKARALALDGKSAEATGELLRQMGGMEELSRMNVIQRDRLASSIGMSAEELTNAAREQSILNSLGVENRKALEDQYEILRRNNDQEGLRKLQLEAQKKEGGEVLLKDIARASLQQRFEESLERVKQIFTEMASGPLINILESVSKFLQDSTRLKIVLSAIAGIAAAIATSMVIATGGTALIGALAAGALVGVGAYASMNGAMSGGAERDTFDKRIPGYNNATPQTPTTTQTPTPTFNLKPEQIQGQIQTQQPPAPETPKPETTAYNKSSDLENMAYSSLSKFQNAVYASMPNLEDMAYLEPPKPKQPYVSDNIEKEAPIAAVTNKQETTLLPQKNTTAPASVNKSDNRDTAMLEALRENTRVNSKLAEQLDKPIMAYTNLDGRRVTAGLMQGNISYA